MKKRMIIITEMEKSLDMIRMEYAKKYKKNIPYTKAQKKLIDEWRKNVKKLNI